MAREAIWLAVWRVNHKIPIILLVLFVLNLAFFFYLSQFLEIRAERLERQYINQQSEVRKAEQGGRSAESPLVVYARGVKDLKTFRQAIPAKSELTGLVGEIFSLAESSGLTIDRIAYRPERNDEMKLLEYTLDFQVSGDYGQIKKFTHKIEQSRRIISIDKMSLGSSSKDDGVNLRLTLTTYFRADAA